MATEQHKKFLDRLKFSSGPVLSVASWLHRSGKTLEIPALRYAPTAGEAESYVDEGDIVVIERKIIQVKGISRSFSGRESWPFREYLISNKAAVDRMPPNVAAFITVSADQACAAIVDIASRPHWYLTQKLCGNTGNVEDFYASSLDHVSFRSI